jgi:imidazolonepropionase-like amidohydrolase
VAALMASKGAFLVPTLIAYDAMDRRGASLGLAVASQVKNREVLDAGKNAIVHARAAGVQIGFGSDLMGDLEDDQLIGLRLQMEPDGVLNTLRSVTSVNADLIGRRELGRIVVGSKGDVVLLDGNPFEDPATLWDLERARTVVQSGRVVV